MPLTAITSDLYYTTNASDRQLAEKVAEHLGLRHDETGAIYGPDGLPVAKDLISLYDTLSTLMWVMTDPANGSGVVHRHIIWQRISGLAELREMARRRGDI
ncbi:MULTISPECIES: hypothetical protein [Mycolicibacter]|uniref:Uncharacterized protein n=2 Tax=Mycolicibacter TaxID=1073531 RepID=A0ABU5XLJ5_9MYCO|nr:MULTISPECIES: hypothetical protein [unclassified Mycolicibacter]MEB3023071.1 hypothetical protein [Mycolicibacter sp. MYC098]MEB3033581.1 hypothetical protein [Mycolicibacter sp. MYC340]